MRKLNAILITLAACCLGGCDEMAKLATGKSIGPEPIPRAAPAPVSEPVYLSQLGVQAGGPGYGDEAPSAVTEANEWKSRYITLMEENRQLLKSKQEQDDKLRALQMELATFRNMVEQSKKELADANSMMHEMDKELREWKKNVLGYRDEMRQAQELQIKALEHIIEMLGGETLPKPAPVKKAAAATSQPAMTISSASQGK